MTLSDRLSAVTNTLARRREDVVSLTSRADTLREQVAKERYRAEDLMAEAETTLRARLLLETYSEQEQAALVHRVEALVSRGLQVIFGPGYGFRIEVGTTRKQASMVFRIIDPEGNEHDPLTAHGGGVVNVVTLVLRLVVVALTPGLSRVVVLDEPFAQLSAGYREGVAEFLRELVEGTGLQLIIVTHEPEIMEAADLAYLVRKTSDGTTISREA